jgi:ribosomal-protein-serine acetyltransferase
MFYIDDALDGIVTIVDELGDDLANRRLDGPGANSPFAILTHCLGVMEDWGGRAIAERAVSRDRAAEFTASGSVAELVARADQARQRLRLDIVDLDPLAPVLPVPGEDPERPEDLVKGAALVHILEELAQHRGQLEITRDQLLARNLVPASEDAPTFGLVADDEVDLVLREEWTWPILHDLVIANIDHLRPWEPWAAAAPTIEATRARNRDALAGWTNGANVPCAIRYRGQIVGSMGARIDTYMGTADIGYWIDAGQAGNGIVTRAARVLIDYLFTARDVQRIEILTTVDNLRSRAVAERLGFTLEGTKRAAIPLGGTRHDEVVYAVLRSDGTASGSDRPAEPASR